MIESTQQIDVSYSTAFVRMVKTVAEPDNRPQKKIGSGNFDYLIGIYFPNERRVALGAKDRIARRITW